MSFDKSTDGALIALRDCLHDGYAAKLATRQTEVTNAGYGYTLPTAPDADSITLESTPPTNTSQYPVIQVCYEEQSWSALPGPSDVASVMTTTLKWWMVHDGTGGGLKLATAEVVQMVNHDIRNVMIRTLRDTTNGVIDNVNYAGGSITDITEAPVGLLTPRGPDADGNYAVIGTVCVQVAHSTVVE